MAQMFVVVGLVLCACAANGNPVDDGFRDDYEYHSKANGWMKLHTIPAVWGDARFACYLEGARLASPTDEGIFSVMEELVQKANKVVYTGVSSMSSPQDYLSLDGIPLSKLPIKWAPNQPDNKDNNERCLTLSPLGMADVDCNNVQHFLCYKKKVEGETFAMNECGTNGQGYAKYNPTSSCYKIHSTPATWYRAHSVCTAEGGHLAILNSEEEAQFLAEMAAKTPHEKEPPFEVYIGFYRWPGSQNAWPDRKPIFYSTIDDKTLEEAGYANWAPIPVQNGVVNNIGIPEACGTFQLVKNELKGLSQTYCYDVHPFVCEIKA